MRTQRWRTILCGLMAGLALTPFVPATSASGAPATFLWGEGRPMYRSFPGIEPAERRRPIAAAPNVPLWQGSFTFQGKNYPYTMVGTDPALGSDTSTIPVAIIPVTFVFADGTRLSATSPVCGGTSTAVSLTQASPLFDDALFAPGGTDVGTTQYIDAYQRANFWSFVSDTAPDYHVLLSPSVESALTVRVPAWAGKTVKGPCARIGQVGMFFFDFVARRAIAARGIPATTLPLFLVYNTFLTEFGSCCILGYHSATGSGQTYAAAAFNDPGVFDQPIEDIHALSHELGEWLADPFGVNPTPAWKAGQAKNCQANLEVGDPVTGIAFSVDLNGTTYHPEDLVFVSWFARQSPSSAVNGWYTFLDTFASAPPVCH